ncbi:GLPGLI family protein [Marixanthomonas ophiurae]|uniref:GLPGLI family protein n=1 Tax=Marixanthomonas ophiurae TaxID=387659 RepID=A0A3E1QAE8_9FLAO|nr:GLPGLI family protein [Marixanthomonas ophiurae]RFN59074.1 GLPGLI family protein [Marixanthomonas ophiurae]
MKYLFILFFSSSILMAQNGKITYTSAINLNGSRFKETKKDLLFNKMASLYQKQPKSRAKTKKNSVTEKQTSSTNKEVNIYISVNNDSIGNQYYYNLKDKTFLCRGSVTENLKLKFYIYEDKGAAKILWKLQNDFKTISGYNCQKATGNFRGRSYEAWFTPEIPLPYGPWKLVGLPGLILEVYDLNKQVYFSADEISIPFKENTNLLKAPNNGKKIGHREFIKKRTERTDKISKAILSRMPQGSKTVINKIEINAIEMEFEWEKE